MIRSRTHVVRRGDARPAVIIIMVALAVFTLLGLILAATLLIGLRRANTKPATPPPKPVAERYGGLLCYCPPDTIALTAIDVAALTADPQTQELADALLVNWNRAHSKRFGQVALSVADVEAYMSARSAGDPDKGNDLPLANRRGTLTVIRFKRSVDDGAVFRGLIAAGFQLEDRVAPGGGRYHELFWQAKAMPPFANVERLPDLNMWFADDRTIVMSMTRSEIEIAMQRAQGRLELRGPLLELVDKADALALEASLNVRAPHPPHISVGPGPGYFAIQTHSGNYSKVMRKASAVWFTIAGDEVRYSEDRLMPDAAQAATDRDAVTTEYAKLRNEVAKWPPGPPVGPAPRGKIPPPLYEGIRELILTAEVGGKDAQVTLTAKLRLTTFARFLKEVMEAGGFPQLPGIPGWKTW